MVTGKCQKAFRWEKFKKWNEHTGYFSGDNILGCGDADKIPSRLNVHLMKYSMSKSKPIDVGIAFTMGHIDTDWLVSPKYPFSLSATRSSLH